MFSSAHNWTVKKDKYSVRGFYTALHYTVSVAWSTELHVRKHGQMKELMKMLQAWINIDTPNDWITLFQLRDVRLVRASIAKCMLNTYSRLSHYSLVNSI